MAIHLSTLVGALPGIGAGAVKDLKNLGIISVRDLLLYFPYRYDDFSISKPIPALKNGDTVTITGTITTIESRKAKNRKMTITEGILENESGSLKVIWFNQPYLEKTLKAGKAVSLAGTVDAKFGITLVNPIHEPAGAKVHTGRIVPVYGRSGSLTIRRLRTAIDAGLRGVEELAEWLPIVIREKGDYPDLPDAIRSIHFPPNREELEKAIARLKFDELFLHQLLFAAVRQEREVKSAMPVPINESFLQTFAKNLPFTLTNAQKRAAWEIIQDTTEEHPMNRLLEGDVGSGKTVVAAMGIAHAVEGGLRAAYLAPTEILAVQQQESLAKLLDAPVALLTSSHARLSDEKVTKKELLSSIEQGDVSCVVGTHALLQEGVTIPNLGFVVIDEQHRFGVQQRHALLESDPAPHLLSMTATPIPRSLALTLYGDLDLSIIKELPKGRKPIRTQLILEAEQEALWQHVRKEIGAGNRVYVVCPLIDPSDKLGSKSVTETVKELSKGALKGKKIEVLHGKMKADEKKQLLEDFRSGAVEVLVSTTVVEVGVDIPDATVMVITGANRFGLAQLHQLRGRVGRSDKQSFCYLVPDSYTPQSKERLMAMVHSQNGFELAEKDLELRGAGNIFGNAQSGFPDFVLATPADTDLMKSASDAAKTLLKNDPRLESHPLLKQKVEESLDQIHLE